MPISYIKNKVKELFSEIQTLQTKNEIHKIELNDLNKKYLYSYHLKNFQYYFVNIIVN